MPFSQKTPNQISGSNCPDLNPIKLNYIRIITNTKFIVLAICCATLLSCRHRETVSDRQVQETAPSYESERDTTSYRVIKIIDGDTFDILIDGKPERIRVFGIDAPEREMPFYKVSKNYLSQLIF